jgi:hypothetical protein
MKKNKINRKLFVCPWCNKISLLPKMNKDTVIVYNCFRCEKPLILFKFKAYKMSEKILNTDNPLAIEEYVVSFLEKKGAIVKDKKTNCITKKEVLKMKKFLKYYKIPLKGDFL